MSSVCITIACFFLGNVGLGADFTANKYEVPAILLVELLSFDVFSIAVEVRSWLLLLM